MRPVERKDQERHHRSHQHIGQKGQPDQRRGRVERGGQPIAIKATAEVAVRAAAAQKGRQTGRRYLRGSDRAAPEKDGQRKRTRLLSGSDNGDVGRDAEKE